MSTKDHIWFVNKIITLSANIVGHCVDHAVLFLYSRMLILVLQSSILFSTSELLSLSPLHPSHTRQSGVNRLIRIMYKDGLYGFAEPLEFHSVVELVDYYRDHSLAPYSPKLDITLVKPISRLERFEMEQEGAMQWDTVRMCELNK